MKQLGTVAAVLLILCLACAAGAQSGAGAAQEGLVTVRAKGRHSVVITEQGRAHTFDLKKQIDAARIEKVSILSRSSFHGFKYFLLDVCGLSKVPPDDRQCGAGVECNVVWLELDAGWRLSRARNVRYESCWAPVTSDEGPKVQGRYMTLTLEDFRDEVRREVTYDTVNPQGGLTVKQTPIPKTTP